jgi:23S rRNA pseudouridine1911/1915/1917 synthase
VSDIRRKVIRPGDADADRRLDVFLSGALTEMSRSRVQRLIREGRVLVDGRVPRPSDLTRAGSVVEVEVPEPTPIGVAPEPLPLSVIYEDPSLVVVDKRAGMVVHPSAGHPDGTLVNALLHRCPDLSGIGGRLRPGIVHRMDKGTSGLLVVAKNDRAHQALAAQFKEHTVDREYLALVWGRFREEKGRFDRPVGRHPRDRKRMSVASPRGRSALTLYRVEREIGSFTLLRLRLRTGRTHQIRVHLSAAGHPVVGDPTYGGGAPRGAAGPRGIRPLLRKMARPALHAALLGFEHPESGERMRFESPLPPELSDFLAGLEAMAGG